MNAKNKAKQASLNNTETRIEKVIARNEEQNNIVLPTTFEGVDADTGRDKFKTPDQCDGDAVALGKVITTGQLRVGEVVLARTTEGDRRLDKRASFSRSSDCGDGGSPGQRGYARIVQANNEAEELAQDPASEFEDSDTPPNCPQGSIKTGSVQFIGKAKVYERYTGSYTQNSDGTYTCDTEEITEPNAIPDSDLADTDTGCVSPLEESGAQPLKRCQWFEATEEEALNYTGCPDGMFNSGFTEFPEGSYKILCCTADSSPAPEQGIGAEWGTSNVIEKGAAAESTGYCSGSARAGLAWSSGNIESQNPPISYELTLPDTVVASITYALNNPSYTYSGYILDPAKQYRVRGTGEGFFGSGRRIDHQWRDYNNFRGATATCQPASTGFSGCLFGGNGVIPFNDAHIYDSDFLLTPTGAVDWGVVFADSAYGDNSGSMTIELIEVRDDAPWVLEILDSTGPIATYEYEEEPTNFQYYCRSSDKNC